MLGPPGALRCHTYSTVFALLSVTGMRISEALNLQFQDVTGDGLWIRKSKFGKTRFIPLHPTAVGGLEKYIGLRRRVVGADNHVVVSVHGRKLAHSVVHYEFRKLVRLLEFHNRPGQPHPRIHDMRHSFATRALESCPEGRDAIRAPHGGSVHLPRALQHLEYVLVSRSHPRPFVRYRQCVCTACPWRCVMTPTASHITAFLRERLPVERMASPNTCDTYAYAFQLLFEFASTKLKVAPSDLCLEQLDASLILAFLAHLENGRGCCPSSRHARLTAIKSFFKYVQYRVPSSLDQVRSVLAVPIKNTQSRLVSYLSVEEMTFLLNTPDPNTRDGIRDRGMLQLAFDAGLRVSELVHLCLDDVSLNLQCTFWFEARADGKGNCRCARRPPPPCGRGLPSAARHPRRNSSSMRPASP